MEKNTIYITIIRKIKDISKLDVLKIGIIIFVSISLVADMKPFYQGIDDHAFGIMGINFAKGSYTYTNELYKETGSSDLVPWHWVQTEGDYLVPLGSPGIIITSAFSFLVGGYYGLFYLGPIFAILFLIISERITTKLFGGFIGLITLVLLGSDTAFFQIGIRLLYDNIFGLFFILGCFYLIKFFRSNKDNLILLSSVFFVIASFFRFHGLIFLPIEVLLVVGYFVVQNISTYRLEVTSHNILSKITFPKINGKKFFKISALMILPWLTIFSFWFIYNNYYFGDPLSNYYSAQYGGSASLLSSFLMFDSDRLDSIIFYSNSFLPDYPGYLIQLFNTNVDDNFGNFLSLFSFFIFISALSIALFTKNKRTEILVFLPFVIIGFLLFYSSEYAVSIGKDVRFMIPALPLTFMLFGFIIDKIWKINRGRLSNKSPKMISKSFKIGFLIFVGMFLFLSLVNTQPVRELTTNNFNYNNPEAYANRYPLDPEGLSEESIIVETRGRNALEYNAIPFLPTRHGKVNLINELDLSLVPQNTALDLKKLLIEGNEAFTFKNHQSPFEPLYFRYLEAEHGIILKDYSKTFCKMVIVENEFVEDGKDLESDEVCYIHKGKVIPKN